MDRQSFVDSQVEIFEEFYGDLGVLSIEELDSKYGFIDTEPRHGYLGSTGIEFSLFQASRSFQFSHIHERWTFIYRKLRV